VTALVEKLKTEHVEMRIYAVELAAELETGSLLLDTTQLDSRVASASRGVCWASDCTVDALV